MQVQLRQVEIKEALKQYLSQKGIDLASKMVEITFTAGRKETGLSADISIEDVAIPGFTDSEEVTEVTAVKPTLVVVTAPAVEAADEPVQTPAEEPTPKTGTSSLFN